MASVKVVVEPRMLQWARERAGFTVQTLADKVGARPNKVADWEIGGELTLKQAEEVAKKTHVPFGYLYLDAPPVEELPINDFRTVGSKPIERISIELRETVDIAMARQDWYRDYAIRNGYPRLDFVGSLTGSEGIVPTAARIRQKFDLDTSTRSGVATWEEALSLQRGCLENQGVLVMRTPFVGEGSNRPLDVDEFRGFALSDDYAPLVFINGADFKAAQMFTLMHELVHIWLGQSGISNLNRTHAQDLNIERFCNAVAAEILVPEAEIRLFNYDVTNIAQLVNHFKVSHLVIFRRLSDFGMISNGEFVHQYRRITEELEEKAQKAKAQKGKRGPSYYKTKISRIGKPFIGAVIESTLEGRSLPTEAFHLLGVSNYDGIKKLAKEMKLPNF